MKPTLCHCPICGRFKDGKDLCVCYELKVDNEQISDEVRKQLFNKSAKRDMEQCGYSADDERENFQSGRTFDEIP